jgi:signal transduction histidine kinase
VIISAALRKVEDETVAGLLREAASHTEREIANLRAIITELRPAALDELGLAPAIEALTARMMAVEGLAIAPRIELGSRTLSPELETTIYRLVQEALTNVGKHARAERATVAIVAGATMLEVEVADDGRGFDPDVATHGFGLAGMRERVELNGGRLTVGREDGGGTVVRATIPLRDVDESVVQRVAH